MVGEGAATGAVFVERYALRVLQEEQTSGALKRLRLLLNRIKTGKRSNLIILSGHGNQTSLEAELATNHSYGINQL